MFILTSSAPSLGGDGSGLWPEHSKNDKVILIVNKFWKLTLRSSTSSELIANTIFNFYKVIGTDGRNEFFPSQGEKVNHQNSVFDM